MTTRKIMHSTRATALAAILAMSAPMLAQAEESASEAWTDSIEGMAEYTAEQRDEAVEAGREAASAIDARIDQMQAWVSKNWDKLSEEAREDRQQIIADLRRQRSDLSEWTGAMKHSTAESWEEVKQGFVNAYEAIGDSYNAVLEKFSSEGS